MHLSICVLSFYKAQVTQFKEGCFNLLNLTVVDGNESISPLSTKNVDNTQGTEYDIVLLFLVKSGVPRRAPSSSRRSDSCKIDVRHLYELGPSR